MIMNLGRIFCLFAFSAFFLSGNIAFAEEIQLQKIDLETKIAQAEKYALGAGVGRDPVKAYGLLMETENIKTCDACMELLQRRTRLEADLEKELSIVHSPEVQRPPIKYSYFQKLNMALGNLLGDAITNLVIKYPPLAGFLWLIVIAIPLLVVGIFTGWIFLVIFEAFSLGRRE